ncbi:MAG: PAS domain S-box protein [Myxococcales bacterium]|nr:MAG: PAS domain S-box protein [Myxococcales bacterium]
MLAVLAAIFAALIGALYVVLRCIVLESFIELEIEEDRDNADLVSRTLYQELKNLSAIAGDWAPWDDTYQFIQDRNQAYIDSNLVDETFINLNLNFMVFVDADRHIFFHKGFDIDARRERSLSDVSLQNLLAPPSLTHPKAVDDSSQGFLDLADGLALVASRPIVTSQFAGPIRGVLIVGRFLDEKLLTVLKERTNLEMQMFDAKGQDRPPEIAKAMTELEKEAIYVGPPLEESESISYFLIRDFQNRPLRAFKVKGHRGILLLGVEANRYSLLAVTAASLLALGLITLILERLILARLARMRNFVNEIARSGDLERRLTVGRRDEISDLARHLNDMLDKLGEAEAQLRLHKFAMDNAAGALYLLDFQGRVRYANLAARRALGVDAEEMQRMMVFDIDPTMTPERWPVHCERKRETGTVVFETMHRRKDGSLFPVEIQSSYFRYGDQEYNYSSAHDISERKAAERALRESAEMMHAILNATTDMVVLVDHGEKILEANQSFAVRFNRRRQDLVGQSLWEVMPADLPPSCRAMLQTVFEGRIPLRQEFEWRDASFEAAAFPARDAAGKVERAAVFLRDLTEKVQAERERKQLQEQLQQAQKMESVGRLAGGVAHDFNNQLTAIIGHLALAMMDLEPGDPLNDSLSEAHQAAQRAANLTRQLLAFSRKQLIDPKVIDLNELICNLHKMLVRLIGEDIELKTLCAAAVHPVKVDPGQIEQAIINLAVNASDAIAGVGKLTIETANVTLDETYCQHHLHVQPGEYVMLAVSDTGCGMGAATRARIFEPFFTTKPKGKGTGLGLSMVYGIVRQHGGSVEVYSEIEQGTTFKIYFPAADEQAVPLVSAIDNRIAPGGSETILLVEDEPAVRSIAVRTLNRQGYHVLEASSGPEAEQTVAGFPASIHLLLTDIVMPKMNGRELAERLSHKLPTLKVLYTSGYSESVIAHHGILEEGLQFLGKPYTPIALARKVREVLDAA